MRRLVGQYLVSLLAIGMLPSTTSARPLGSPDALPLVFAEGVELVANIPDPVTAVGARLVDGYFYVSSGKGIHIYDVADPEAPVLTGTFDLPHDVYYGKEDVDTNGEILLLGVDVGRSNSGELLVIDVSNKAAPTMLSSLTRGVLKDHTWSCVLSCSYAYSDNGDIVDLRNPASPALVGDWTEGLPSAAGAHDVTEVASGLILTSSKPMLLIDARVDPLHPRPVAAYQVGDGVYEHGNLWPRNTKDRFMLLSGEKVGPCAKTQDAGLFTFDVSKWRSENVVRPVDMFRLSNGSPTEGDALYNTNCAHWFDTHPAFRNGGLVAMAWYEHGTRILSIDGKGQIEEKGYLLPADGSAWGSYWISEDIVYTVDYNRGLDILRVLDN